MNNKDDKFSERFAWSLIAFVAAGILAWYLIATNANETKRVQERDRILRSFDESRR